MKLEHFLTPYTKINSKWIKDLNIRPETIKLLEENIGKTLSDMNHSRILYDPPPRILEIKAKINKWDLIKLEADFFNLLHPHITDLLLYFCLSYQTTWRKLSRAVPSRGCSCFICAPGSSNSSICLLCVAETDFVINLCIMLREGEGSPALVYGRLCMILVNSFGFGRRQT